MKAEKLAKLLAELQGNKSQAWLAKEMNVTPSRLGTYVRGEIEDISVDFLSHVADYMGIELDELMKILGEPKKQKRLTAKDIGVAYLVSGTTFEDVEPGLERLTASQDIAKAINLLSRKLISA